MYSKIANMKILRCILILLRGNQIRQFNQQNTNRNHDQQRNSDQSQQVESVILHDCELCQRFDNIKYVELNGQYIKLICQNCRNLRSLAQIFPVVHFQDKNTGVFKQFAYVLDKMNMQLRNINIQSREDIRLNISWNSKNKRKRLLFCGINYQKLQSDVDELIFRHEHLQIIQEQHKYICIKEATLLIEQFFNLVNTHLNINNLEVTFKVITQNDVNIQLAYQSSEQISIWNIY